MPGSGTLMVCVRLLRVSPYVDLEVARSGGCHRHERPSGVAPLPRRWRGHHRQPGLRRLVPAHQPGTTDTTAQGGQAPCSDDGRDTPWGTQGWRRVEGQATRMVTGLCARGLLAFALRPTYHG